jgi:choline dehydrogenase-like flavoprotein
MAERLKPVDVVTIGVGLTGSLAALELVREGLRVVGIERGAMRETVPDFQSPAIHDELRFAVRKGLMQDNVKEAVTFRNSSDQTALPIRRWAACREQVSVAPLFIGTGKLSFSSRRFHLPDAYRATLWQEISRCMRPRAHHPGLGRHLSRARAPLRSFRVSAGSEWQGRKHQGPDSTGRKPV